MSRLVNKLSPCVLAVQLFDIIIVFASEREKIETSSDLTEFILERKFHIFLLLISCYLSCWSQQNQTVTSTILCFRCAQFC